MKRLSENLIKEYHSDNIDRYPGISIEQAKEICHGPWNFLKKEMENGELHEVRFKYFGTFQVYIGRVKGLLNSLKERFRFNKIDRSEYFRRKETLDNFIKKHEEQI